MAYVFSNWVAVSTQEALTGDAMNPVFSSTDDEILAQISTLDGFTHYRLERGDVEGNVIAFGPDVITDGNDGGTANVSLEGLQPASEYIVRVGASSDANYENL